MTFAEPEPAQASAGHGSDAGDMPVIVASAGSSSSSAHELCLKVSILPADLTPAGSPPVEVPPPVFPPVGVTPPVAKAGFPLVVVHRGDDSEPEPDLEPGYALPAPPISSEVGGNPVVAVAAGASAGSSHVEHLPDRGDSTAALGIHNRCAASDVRERSEPAPAPESAWSQAPAAPPPRTWPVATPEEQQQIEAELRASIPASRAYVERNQQALPIFSPLMVIPGAAN